MRSRVGSQFEPCGRYPPVRIPSWSHDTSGDGRGVDRPLTGDVWRQVAAKVNVAQRRLFAVASVSRGGHVRADRNRGSSRGRFRRSGSGETFGVPRSTSYWRARTDRLWGRLAARNRLADAVLPRTAVVGRCAATDGQRRTDAAVTYIADRVGARLGRSACKLESSSVREG